MVHGSPFAHRTLSISGAFRRKVTAVCRRVVLISHAPASIGTKRTGSAERSPEIAKRAKMLLSSPVKSPAAASPVPHSSPPQPPPPATKTPSLAPAAPPAVPFVPAATAPAPAPAPAAPVYHPLPPILMERYRALEFALRGQAAKVQKLEQEGNLQLAAQQRIELAKRVQWYKEQKEKHMRDPVSAAAAAAQAEEAAAKAAVARAGATSAANALPGQTATDLAAKIAHGQSGAPPAPAAGGQNASQQPMGPPPGMQIPPNMTPEVAAQMQKLIEQKNRPGHLNMPPQQPQPQPQPPAAASQPQSQPPGPGPGQPQAGSWQGMLSWRGTDSETHIRKDVQARVTIHGQNAELMYVLSGGAACGTR